MTKPLNVNEPVQTRDGHKARIVCTDIKGIDDNIGALITGENGHEGFYRFYPDGRYHRSIESNLDLINVPKRIQGWVNLYPGIECLFAGREIYKTKEEANDVAQGGPKRTACLYIDFTEGEGLL